MFKIFVIAILCVPYICNAGTPPPPPPLSQDNLQRAIFTTYNPTQNIPVNPSQAPQTFQIDNDYWDNDDFVPSNVSRHDMFDWKLIKALLTQDNSNIIISPFSVKLLLSLLAEAAGKGTSTHKELSAVLPTVVNNLQARELYGNIFASLKQKSPDYELNIGTKIYVDDLVIPKQRYASIIEAYYSTMIERIDFKQAQLTADKINAWCSEITQNQIQNLVNIEDIQDSVMIMLNAIYFNGYWRRPFPQNETIEAAFFTTPTTQVKTTYMQQTSSFFYLDSPQLDAKILRLPYKGRKFAMTVILPNTKAGLDELVHQMDSTSLHRAQYFMDEVEVRVQLPKFKFEHTAHLNDVLQMLGITQIFTPQASLPQLDRGADLENRLQVSKVLQKAGIFVNEKGSTVFAATEIVLTNKFGGDTTKEFIANRPFMFLIEDENTGTLLFTGKVTNPADFIL